MRSALGAVAVGTAAGEAPDRSRVGVALLSLLSAVAEARSIPCLIHDAQWLDAASAQVIAVRELAEGHDFDGLPEQTRATCRKGPPAHAAALRVLVRCAALGLNRP